MTVTMLVKLDVKPGQMDAARSAMAKAVELSQTEDGCIAYDLYSVDDDPDTLYLWEVWQDQAALDTHMKQPHMPDLMAALFPTLARDPDMIRLSRTDG